jgi:hypothetical protein
VAAFHTPHLQLPYFALYPESFLSVVGELFGFNDIDFETHPGFSKRFKLSGKEELRIRLLFDYPMLAFFEKTGRRQCGGGRELSFHP